MKFVFLTGGFVGFALAASSGLSAGREAGFVLRDAAVGCLVGALLFRWFWSVVVKALAVTLERRRNEASAKAAEPASSTPAPVVSGTAAARSR
jgi:divalent metal cation (Fe/Co/Zn/Cd) transporter